MICTPLKHCRSDVSFALQLAVIVLAWYRSEQPVNMLSLP